jgi:shikimate kinase
MTPRVILVGLPGAGKTTTGRRLAKILAADFADSDELVEAATGRTVATLFEEGEQVFRAAEAEAISTALRDFDGVLALGGGALTTAATRAAISASAATVVLLRARVPTLADRVGAGQSRPLLSADPANRLRALADERGPTYAEAAAFVVDTDGRTPGQVASHIAAELHRRGVQGV